MIKWKTSIIDPACVTDAVHSGSSTWAVLKFGSAFTPISSLLDQAETIAPPPVTDRKFNIFDPFVSKAVFTERFSGSKNGF